MSPSSSARPEIFSRCPAWPLRRPGGQRWPSSSSAVSRCILLRSLLLLFLLLLLRLDGAWSFSSIPSPTTTWMTTAWTFAPGGGGGAYHVGPHQQRLHPGCLGEADPSTGRYSTSPVHLGRRSPRPWAPGGLPGSWLLSRPSFRRRSDRGVESRSGGRVRRRAGGRGKARACCGWRPSASKSCEQWLCPGRRSRSSRGNPALTSTAIGQRSRPPLAGSPLVSCDKRCTNTTHKHTQRNTSYTCNCFTLRTGVDLWKILGGTLMTELEGKRLQ